MADDIRLDKWLWAVRIFKTRSDAADACRNNRVLVNNSFAKPSRDIKIGDVISIKKMPVTYSFRVLAMVSSRQGAKLVANFMENITPQEELDKLNAPKHAIFIQRDHGMGRPTKRERRDIDDLMDNFFYPDEDEDN